MESKTRWFGDHRLWLEGFVLVNLACLAPDIYLAHSVNAFRHRAEYVPLYFSLAAPVLLLAAEVVWLAWSWRRAWVVLGHLVGWAAVGVGVAGLVLHLGGRFFQERTLDSLVYAAPFAAPLAYTGLGLLLIMNRMVDAESPEWPLWVLLLALGGFVGNFIFSLTDHAQNGFYHKTEWIPVVSSGFAVGFLTVPFFVRVDRSYLWPCVIVLLAQAVVGLVGFYLHTAANLKGPAPTLWDNTLYGASPLAPLLFPNLVLLAFIGLWVWRRHLAPAGAAARGAVGGDAANAAPRPAG
jgi:hypothetical protein